MIPPSPSHEKQALLNRDRHAYAVVAWISILFVLTSLVDGFWKRELLRGPHIQFWLFDLTRWIVLPVVLLLCLHRVTDFSAKDYGLDSKVDLQDLLQMLLLPLLSLFLVNFITEGIANGILGYPVPDFRNRDPLAELGPLWILGTIYFSATAGLWESVFLIGLPWLWFSRKQPMDTPSKCLFGIVSALLFATCHWENGLPNMIGAFFFQALAVWWYFRLGTLWPIVAAHFLIDVYYFWPGKIAAIGL